MAVDGWNAGRDMAVELIQRAFNELAVSFAAADQSSALAALARVELLIADSLTEFRQWSGNNSAVYNDAFEAMVYTVSTLVEDAREAVQNAGKPAA